MKKNITLSQFISDTRENIGLSQKGLAIKANIDIAIVEAIEAGHDLFLAATIRQKLAKALKLEPKEIKVLEKQPYLQNAVPEDIIEELRFRIIDGSLKNNPCPVCGEDLVCRIAEMYDLEDNLVKHPKARCSKCPFQLK